MLFLAYGTTITILSTYRLARDQPGDYLYLYKSRNCKDWCNAVPTVVRHARYAVLRPWRMEIDESVERHLKMSFAGRYASEDVENLTRERWYRELWGRRCLCVE